MRKGAKLTEKTPTRAGIYLFDHSVHASASRKFFIHVRKGGRRCEKRRYGEWKNNISILHGKRVDIFFIFKQK